MSSVSVKYKWKTLGKRAAEGNKSRSKFFVLIRNFPSFPSFPPFSFVLQNSDRIFAADVQFRESQSSSHSENIEGGEKPHDRAA